jgi:hypothetical protein
VQQNVLRLEIAVDHTMAVRVIQRRRDRGREVDRLVDRKLLLAHQSRAERFPLDVRHDVEQQAIRLTAVEQWQQIRMLQVGRDLDLREEALDTKHRSKLRVEHFQSDTAIVSDVAREIDGRHAAAADLTLDGIASSE